MTTSTLYIILLLCMLIPRCLTVGTASLKTTVRGPARWWEKAGTTVRSVSPKCALGEGLSTLGQMRGLPSFLAMLNRLHKNNVSTLQLFTVYDSGDGFDPHTHPHTPPPPPPPPPMSCFLFLLPATDRLIFVNLLTPQGQSIT